MAQDVLGRSSGKETFSKVVLFLPFESLESPEFRLFFV